MRTANRHRRIKFKKHRRYRNKLGRRFWVVRAHRQGRKVLPLELKEFGL